MQPQAESDRMHRLVPRHILVRGVNWLGDAVLSTPALLRLRQWAPSARVALLTRAKLAPLWEHHPCVNQVIPVGEGEGPLQVAGRLRPERFDLALLLPSSPRVALESFLARIPQRVGYARPWRNWLLTRALPERPGFVPTRKRSTAEIRRLIVSPPPVHGVTSPDAHHVYHYLHLVAALGASAEPAAPHIEVLGEEAATVRAKFRSTADHGAHWPLFGLNAGAEYGPAKRWPAEQFIATAVALHQQTNCLWWIFGGQSDRGLAEHIHRGITQASASAGRATVNLAGLTTLRELCAALQACAVVLTNDTGPMHLAAAVGTPVVALFGSTSPELTCPGLPGEQRHAVLRSRAPCSPCFRRECPIDFRCLKEVSVEAAVRAVLDTWRKAEPQSTRTTR